jgi:hypothetical protein
MNPPLNGLYGRNGTIDVRALANGSLQPPERREPSTAIS